MLYLFVSLLFHRQNLHARALDCFFGRDTEFFRVFDSLPLREDRQPVLHEFCLDPESDTDSILPLTLGTGTHILDVGYQVDLEAGAKLLRSGQVFCGNLSPASDVLNGRLEDFAEKVRAIDEKTGRRVIISAGCDIPPATAEENMIAFRDAVLALGK